MRLKDKVAVITGGGRGIGRAIALAFAREGADVLVTARTATEIEQVAAEVKALGRRGVALPVDLSQRNAVPAFLEQVFSHFPSVHILVNNAGIGSGQNPKPIMEFDDAFWDLTLFLNLTVPYLLTKAFLPKMVEQGWGRIINISSVAGKRGFPYGSAYSASKHGLIGLTRTAALEVAATGVTVNAICPGPIRTAMLAKRLQFEAERLGMTVEEVERTRNPIQRLLEPEEVAALAVYLASEEAGGMTGQSLTIAGGSIMH
ncbi:MAG: SDR family oxidoreductase [Nitrospinota bacterium]|nr:MAG: SDR family oxidoreductase [Nitrospinota bacterium]